MDNRYGKNHNAIAACLGATFLACFTLAMGKLGFGKPKKDPVKQIVQAPMYSNTVGRELADFSQTDMYAYLSGRGFKIAANMPLHEMRRMYLAYWYRPLFDSVSVRTGFSSDVLFAFFIMEATREGVESPMFSDTWNPGGVKYRGKYTPYYSYDDCFENGKAAPCAFENPGSFANAVALWSDVFNHPRYSACKTDNITASCKCLEQAGYHTAKNHAQRARIAKSYRKYRKCFPGA